MEKTRTHLVNLWAPVIFWVVLIFVGSSLSAVSTSPNYWSDFVVKKSVHLVEYFVLYLLSWRAFRQHFQKRYFIAAFLFILFYAISDEFHQLFVPGREPRALDVIIDAAGGLLGVWFLKNLQQKIPTKLKNWLSVSPSG